MPGPNKHFFDPMSLDEDEEQSTASAAPVGVPEELPPSVPSELPPMMDNGHELSQHFEDPQIFSMEALSAAAQETAHIDNISQNTAPVDPSALLMEAHDAVQELIGAPAEMDPLLQVDSNFGMGEMSPAPALFAEGPDSGILNAQVQMASELFELTLCEYKFEVLVEEILKTIMRAIDAQAGSILELDTPKGEFFFRAAFGGEPDKVKSFRIPMNKGIVGHVAESRECILINELQDDDKQLRSISVAVGFEAKSCMAAPIVIANQLYGVIEVFNKVGISYFDDRDCKLLQEACHWAAKVLEVRFFAAEMMRQKRGE
jgi:hypothetical protein